MKKFTGNFLFDEHSLGYVLRKIGLSMVAILMAVAVYAQPQDTYHIFAEDVEDCYRQDNDYQVAISMRDFVKIDSFYLSLTFDDDIFTYESVSDVVTELGTGTGLSVTTSAASGNDTLIFVWNSNDNPQTISPDNDTTEVFVLHFSLNGYQHVDDIVTTSFSTNLTWEADASSVWNWTSGTQSKEILTWYYADGGIEVTQTIPDVVVDVTGADCDGGQAVATVTTPAAASGIEYSFNADDDWNTEDFTTLTAPSTGHTVIAREVGAAVGAGNCVSYVESFDVDAQPPFSYTVQEAVYVNCPNGDGDVEFTATGGTTPYSYYIVPEADTAQVIADITAAGAGQTNSAAIAYLDGDGYGTARITQLPVGFYLAIAVDDNQCINVRNTANWQTVEVLDTLDEWTVVETNHADETCAGSNDGETTLYVTGATPFVDGYNILVNGVQESSRSDSMAWTGLVPGDYDIVFVDSLNCQWDTTITIVAATEIDFAVDHTDASCDLNNGELWLDTLNITGGAGSYDYWVYSTDPNFFTADTVTDINEVIDTLAPNVYYVKLFDDNGCSSVYENINGDNAVKVLSIDFTITYDSIACYGGTTDATVTVTNPGNHGFKFNIDGGTWTTDNVFEDLMAGTYTFGVNDTTIDCQNYWTQTIGQPDSLYVEVIDLLTLEPSCHDNTDGNIQVRGYNGITFESMGESYFYEYKFNDRPWEEGQNQNTFAAGTGTHTIVIKDYYGCTDTTTVTLFLSENLIAVDDTMLDCNGDMTTLTVDTVSWIHEPSGLSQGEREPRYYYSSTTGDAAEILTQGWEFFSDSTEVGAGVYYFVAEDEWGCISNVDTVTVSEPLAVIADAVKIKDAGCDGVTDGEIRIRGWNALTRVNPHGPDTASFRRYQYAITQSQIMNNLPVDEWVDEVSWSEFENDDPLNDSIVFVDLQKGTYYVAVRGYCAIHGRPELTVGPMEVVVGGGDGIVVDRDAVTVNDVTCNVMGEDPSDDGSIMGLVEATTGGLVVDTTYQEGFIFTISGANVPEDYEVENTSGNFMDLPAGWYTITITSDSLLCVTTEDFEVEQPDAFGVETEILYASCNGVHDGVIRYHIMGGTAPFEETTNNVGMYEDPANIPDDRWYSPDSTVYDRRMRAGIYATWVRDDNGCIYGPVMDTIRQPEPLMLEVAATAEPSCAGDGNGVADDGQIWVIPSGGWNDATDNYKYVVTLGTDSYTVELGDTVFFTGLTASNYTIDVVEANAGLPANPIITYSNYFAQWGLGAYDSHLPWQNSATDCYYEIEVDLQGPDAIAYDTVTFSPVKCKNDANGEIHLMGITGGTAPYSVWVEGPNAYRPAYGGVGDTILLVDTVDSEAVYLDEYLWDDLIPGHYTVFIMDDQGCQLVQESGEIEEPDTLMITNTELVDDALCYGGMGTIQIDATGGVGEYQYAVDSALVPNDGTHPIPHDDLVWQDSDTFNVISATWVAWVKDANGCIVGYATDADGDPILQHRVTVLEPDPVELSGVSQDSANCYAASDGMILIDTVWGGNGGAWSAEVSGLDYDGNEVMEFYSNIGGADIELDGLPASTNKDANDMSDWTEDDYYTITIYDSEGCMVIYDEGYVLQPDPFMVVLEDKNDAFVCPNDLAGVFEMKVISGGTPFGYNGSMPIYEYKWEAYTEDSVMVDSLQADWGFTSTFQGYAGFRYHVTARDANGCIAETDTFIIAPEDINFIVEDLTCHGDEFAAARVEATGTPERMFRVLYKEIENDVPSTDTFIVYNGWFEEMIDITDAFIFDNENFIDRHYAIMVEDELGCRSLIDTLTFDAVQSPLTLDVERSNVTECTEDIAISVVGGTEGDGYTVMVNDSVLVDWSSYTLARGQNIVKVMDSHMCEVSEIVDVTGDYVTRDTTIETFVGYKTEFVDEEAGVDTMLAVGDHQWMYMFGDCERTLNVTVVEVPRPVAIADIQGEGDETPWMEEIVIVNATITGVSESEGFYMQDANTAWSGIWVAWSDTEGLEIGEGVEVVGEVGEVADVTTISATEVTEVDAVLTVEPVVLGNPLDVESEMYESVVVKVEGARATEADTVTGEWTIYYEPIEDAVVNDLLYSYMPVDSNYYDVTGIVNARLDAFKLEPRMESDIVDLTETTNVVDMDLVQFKVYPNPFNNRIHIENNDKLTRVVISNIAGQRVIDVEYPNKEIRTANLVSGVYIVSMFTEDGIAKSERIVKR